MLLFIGLFILVDFSLFFMPQSLINLDLFDSSYVILSGTPLTINSQKDTSPPQQNQLLNPFYVTGFTDGEGSFGIYFTKYSQSKAGYLIQPNFQITLHKNDYALLEKIKNFFGVGGIYKDGKNLFKYSVRSLKDLGIIIKHFEKYQLQTQKRTDFELFKEIIELLLNKKHLAKEGDASSSLKKIVSLKAAMNKGLSSSLKEAFPDLIPSPRPLVLNQKIEDPN